MAYCAPKGIPLSVFLTWSDTDQEAALAWQAHESRRCGSCGTHPDDWSRDRHAFHAEMYVCPGCVEVQRRQDDPAVKGSTQRGLHVRLAHGHPRTCTRCTPADD
jgi:hypothetical protein